MLRSTDWQFCVESCLRLRRHNPQTSDKEGTKNQCYVTAAFELQTHGLQSLGRLCGVQAQNAIRLTIHLRNACELQPVFEMMSVAQQLQRMLDSTASRLKHMEKRRMPAFSA